MEANGTDTTLLLRHREVPTVFGSLTFEPESGFAKRLCSQRCPQSLARAETKRRRHQFGFVAGRGQGAQPGVRQRRLTIGQQKGQAGKHKPADLSPFLNAIRSRHRHPRHLFPTEI